MHGVTSSARLLDEGPVSWVVCLPVRLLVLPESILERYVAIAETTREIRIARSCIRDSRTRIDLASTRGRSRNARQKVAQRRCKCCLATSCLVLKTTLGRIRFQNADYIAHIAREADLKSHACPRWDRFRLSAKQTWYRITIVSSIQRDSYFTSSF